jgi:hypothetical protein
VSIRDTSFRPARKADARDPGDSMAKDAGQTASEPKGEDEKGQRACSVCGTKLSSYNPGPNCWQHTIGYPWRGPSAKPRYD